MDKHLVFGGSQGYSFLMSSITNRKYIKTKFDGIFYRLSSKRNSRTGEQDRIYCFWYADAHGKGHWKTVGRHSEGVRPSTVHAERIKFLAELNTTGLSPADRAKVTVGEVIDAYCIWGRSEGKYVDQQYRQYSYHLKEKIHCLPLVALTPNLLTHLKIELLNTAPGNRKRKLEPTSATENRQHKTLAAQTINNLFSFIRAAVNRAIATGMWIGNNPLSTKEGKWSMVKGNNKRLRFLTREEVKTLLNDLQLRHPQLHDMVLLSLKTGLRPTEIFRLRGQDIDANACLLHIIAKGGKRMPVRVPESIIKMLQAYKRSPSEPVFQRANHKNFSRTPPCFRAAIKRLGLEPKDGDSLYTITLHTMRHTFASWLAQSGKVSLMELQKLMRHEHIEMTMRYAHLFPGQESEKLSIIDDILE